MRLNGDVSYRISMKSLTINRTKLGLKSLVVQYKVRFERELLEKNIAEKATAFSSFC